MLTPLAWGFVALIFAADFAYAVYLDIRWRDWHFWEVRDWWFRVKSVFQTRRVAVRLQLG
jgi:hypothetical protein